MFNFCNKKIVLNPEDVPSEYIQIRPSETTVGDE
jgi:hypothetical protein